MILHVACLPFPSYQGTQAAIAAMLEASARAGRETHVLTYAHGAYPLDVPYRFHRIPDFPRVRSLRSGPSLGKLALDARCVTATRRLVEQLRPEAVIAHHVEAALAARLAGAAPLFYVAHTSLETELSVYFPRLPASVLRSFGSAVDRAVIGMANATGAVAPALAHRLGDGVVHVPVPWRDRFDASSQDHQEHRDHQDPQDQGAVMLYAGNLDAYQGWEDLLDALRILRSARSDARLLVASESDPTPVRRRAAQAGVLERVDFCRLDGETARARVHQAADLAWIPRRTEGGLPIKMLDAFARSIPVVTTKRATAGLPVHDACEVVPDDDPSAFANASLRLLDDARARHSLIESAHRYLATHHSDEAYLTALDSLLDRRATRPAATPNERHPQAARELQAR